MARVTRSMKARPKAKPTQGTPAALDYAAWKKAARAILREQHGIDAPKAPPDQGRGQNTFCSSPMLV